MRFSRAVAKPAKTDTFSLGFRLAARALFHLRDLAVRQHGHRRELRETLPALVRVRAYLASLRLGEG
ncbi:MAG TPA: hypothetical protein VE621_05800 [Bryobacteraceae bacterium]|nr:hypothetical protein [Bryobacteraceae bacterium]